MNIIEMAFKIRFSFNVCLLLVTTRAKLASRWSNESSSDWGCCFFYCFPKITGYCANTPSAWLRITIDIVGGALALALTDVRAAGREVDHGCSAVTDRNPKGLLSGVCCFE